MPNLGPFDISISSIQPEHLSEGSAWIEHLPFAFWLIQALRPKVLVELGTHRGDSYCAFCQAANLLNLESRFFAVDTWQGDSHTGFYDENLFARLSDYHDSRYGDFSTLLRMQFDDALEQFHKGEIDLLHIDGFHSYEAAKNDFENWSPKLSDRAVVLFHDIEHQSDNFGVATYWQEISACYPHFAFSHGNGLGVLLVGSNVPSRFIDFISYARKHADTVRQHFYLLSISVTRAQRQRYSTFRLYVDRGNNYSNETSVIAMVCLDKRSGLLEFDCGEVPVSSNKVFRLDPGEIPIVLQLEQVQALSSNGKALDFEISVSNALFQHGSLYIFDQLDPYIHIDIKEPRQIKRLRLNYHILAIDEELKDFIPGYLASCLAEGRLPELILQNKALGHWGNLVAALHAGNEAKSKIANGQ